jgi:hypothetical protein
MVPAFFKINCSSYKTYLFIIIKVKHLNDAVQSINTTHNTTLTQNNSIIKVEQEVDKCNFKFF